MGLFPNPFAKKRPAARPALEEAAETDDQVTGFIAQVLGAGIDGRGKLKSAVEVATDARRKGSTEKAIDDVVARHTKLAAAGGFVTGLGGFATMLVALPANVLSFYVISARMVASIAHLRGYDINKPEMRTAVLLALAGSDADAVLRKAGLPTSGGIALGAVASRLPRSALMVVNKAVGFRLIKGISTKLLGRLGRMVPLVGGGVGATIDVMMLRKIAEAARREFPQK